MAENRELALVLKLVADQFTSELKKSQGVLSGFNDFIKDWKTQLTAVSATLIAVAKSTADYGDQLVKASQRLGTTIEDTARLQHAAKLSDTDLQGLSATVGHLSKEMVSAAAGNAGAVQNFELLGISVRGSNGQLKSTTEILLEMNDKFRLMPDGPTKTGQAMLVLGKNAKEVLPFLNSDLREAFAEADKLGLVMSEKDARAAEHFNDEITKLQGSIRGLTNDIGSALIPKFDAITHALTTIITDARTAAEAITGIGKSDLSQAGVIKPEGGGRNLRIVPAPSRAEQDKFIPEPSGFSQRSQEEIGKALLARFVMEEKIKESLGKQQEERGKALLELYLASNRAIDIENKLRTEGADIYRLQTDRKEQREKEDDAYQERQGKAIVEQTSLEVRVREEARSKELQGLTDNLKAWQDYGEQIGGSTEFILNKRLDLVRVELAKELDTNVDTAGKLLIAWQNSDEDALRSLQVRINKTDQELETSLVKAQRKYRVAINELSGDFVEGWASGMRDYVRNTKSGFGLASDMARRAVQTMEQGFQTFFFDAMEGRITRLKDVMTAFLNFTKQIVSQLAGQLITKQIAGAIAGSGSFGSSGVNTNFTGDLSAPLGKAATGGMVQRFAGGGPVFGNGNLDTIPALLTPGEFVLSRRDVSDIKSGLGSRVIINTYNTSSAQVEHQVSQGPDGATVITQTIRNVVTGMVQSGGLDRSLGQRYGVTPSPARR